jgi:pyruvate formate lyase activating enzyme
MQVYVAEYNELSNVDLPGKTCDVIFFAGCDFNCPFCNVPEMLHFREEYVYDIRDLKERIKNNSKLIEAVKFTGGEPTLQRQPLMELCKFSKKLGLRTILHTNGSKPDCLKSLFKEKLVDEIIFDLKSPLVEDKFERVTKSKTFFKQTKDTIEDVKESLKLIKENGVNIEFKTLVVPSLMFKKESLLEIAEIVKEYNSLWTLTKFQPSNCLVKRFNAIDSPSDMFLENLKEIIQQKFPEIKVEI